MKTRAFCATLFAASIAYGMASSVYATEMRPIEWGINRPGEDLNHYGLVRNDATLCQDDCAGNQQCRAWVYTEDTNTCWLKKAVPGAVVRDKTAAGVKTVQ